MEIQPTRVCVVTEIPFHGHNHAFCRNMLDVVPAIVASRFKDVLQCQANGGNPDVFEHIEFWPPRGSSELYQALQRLYPHIPTHSGRMGRAVMDFYDGNDPCITAISDNIFTPSSFEGYFFDVNDFNDSPIYLPQQDFPTYIPSNISYATTSSRSVTPDTPETTDAPENDGPDEVPAMNTMLGWFSITLPGQAKGRIRRPMTAKEKADYRQIREKGACETCKKRKRKCQCRLLNQKAKQRDLNKQALRKNQSRQDLSDSQSLSAATPSPASPESIINQNVKSVWSPPAVNEHNSEVLAMGGRGDNFTHACQMFCNSISESNIHNFALGSVQ